MLKIFLGNRKTGPKEAEVAFEFSQARDEGIRCWECEIPLNASFPLTFDIHFLVLIVLFLKIPPILA